MHINGFTCDFWKLVERNFAMQESKRMLVALLDSCMARFGDAGIQVACRCVSGFASSKTSLCWNPCGCSSHLWIPVLWNSALQESRSTATGYLDFCTAKLRYRGIQRRDGNLLVKIKTFASISAHEFAHEFAPLMLSHVEALLRLKSLTLGSKTAFGCSEGDIFVKTSGKQHHEEKTCSAPQLQQPSPPLKKCHFYRRGQVSFKNVILTEHGKHKKNMLLTEHGKQFFEFCNTSAVKHPLFFRHLYRRGVQKIEKSYSYGAWEAKKVLHTEHGRHIFEFCNTPRAFWTFFWPRSGY